VRNSIFETPHCNVRHGRAEIETIYAAYQVLLLKEDGTQNLNCTSSCMRRGHNWEDAGAVVAAASQFLDGCSKRKTFYRVSRMAEYGECTRYLGQIT
jgi:hypothetical protein